MRPDATQGKGARRIGIVVALPAEARTLDALDTSTFDIVADACPVLEG